MKNLKKKIPKLVDNARSICTVRNVVNVIRLLPYYRIANTKTIHQLPEHNYLRRFLKEFSVDCVFDIGANEGQYARMLRKHAGYEGYIVSYEPQPDIAMGLRRLAKRTLNGLSKNALLGLSQGRKILIS